MKKEYFEPEAEWIRFSDCSVITGSGDEHADGEGEFDENDDTQGIQW